MIKKEVIDEVKNRLVQAYDQLAIYLFGSYACGLIASLDRYVKTYADLELFSGSVLVAQKGKMLLSKGYGMANYERMNLIFTQNWLKKLLCTT